MIKRGDVTEATPKCGCHAEEAPKQPRTKEAADQIEDHVTVRAGEDLPPPKKCCRSK